MRSEYEGMALWYGTPDAPAPKEAVQAGTDVTITIGVEPTNAGNNVEVLYRINQGPTEKVAARWLRNDTYKKSQYFKAQLPALRVGDTVDYTVLCRRAGRQVVPAPHEAEHFASSFRVVDATVQFRPEPALYDAMKGAQGNASPSFEDAVQPDNPASPLLKLMQGLTNKVPVADDARDVVMHPVYGQLVNQETGAPLVGFTVHAFDLDAGATPRDLGYQVTNGNGLFAIIYTMASEASPKAWKGVQAGRRYQLHILDPQAHEFYQTEIRVKPDQEQAVEIRVPVPKPPILTLSELATTLRLKLPQQLLPTLAKHGIRSLADIHEAGGIRHIEGLPVTADDPALQTLEAHANLSVLSSDVPFNAMLIDRGYTGIRRIAETPQSVFISAVRNQLGDFKAAQLHVQARAQTRFLANVLTQVRADKANGFNNPFEHQVPALEELNSCDCEDCRAAVSPAAYLLDLIDYTIQNLSDSGNPIDLAWLTANFHQPFAALVVSCDAVEALVHQVRICIEVLRSYLPTGTEFPGESDYRREAYLTLLSKVGTSYEEIRLARTMDPEKRKALADRIGIGLGTGSPDRIDQLFFDLSKPQTLTEKALEDLFGLVDTTRNPLTAGSEPKFLRWRLEYLRTLWHAQDRPTLPNAGLPIIDPDVISHDDFRDPKPGNPSFDLWQTRRNAVVSILNQLASDYQAHGLTFILQKALVTPLPDLNALKNSLDQGTNIDQTKATITNTLNLTIESFNRLMGIKVKIDGNQPVTPAELQELFAILAEAEKVKLFANWITEEQTKNIVLRPDQFWIALKEPDLTPWLATTEARQAWQQALRIRSQPPIIDPDLIGQLDFKNPNPADPAYTIWQNRGNQRDQQLTNWGNQVGNQPGNIDTLIASVLGTPVTDLVDLAARRTKGEDISARLDQLSIDLDAFLRLLDLRKLILSNAPVLDDEWKEFYSILLQTWKRRQFATWRDEEEQQNILLSPDYFVIPAPSLLPLVPQPTMVLVKWRATVQARNDWQDTLQSRIDQQQAIKDGLNNVIDTCEEETLPILRDALLMQVDPANTDLQSKAKWFTINLLIDAQVNGCQKTTRIAQAIETVQVLLLSVRTGQFADSPTYAGLAIDDNNFDEEWKWIGSYATWRAAMFIFLYPENVLIPSLRKVERQTPAFRNFVGMLRPNRRLTPEQACEAASSYADYFRDISNLTIEASCTALTHIQTGDCRDKTLATQDRPLFYMFARGTSNTVYWSSYDAPQDQTGYGQTFWDTIPGLDKALQIIGAVPYLPRDDKHSILLFAKTREKGVQKFVMTTYDLLAQGWSGDLIELDLPQKDTDFSVVVQAHDELNLAPQVVFCLRAAPGTKDGDDDLSGQQVFYARYINVAGTDWVDEDFRLLWADTTSVRVLAMVSFLVQTGFILIDSDWSMLFVETRSSSIAVGIFPAHLTRSSQLGFPIWRTIENKSLVGAFMYPNSGGEAYIFVRDKKTGAVSYGAQGIIAGVPFKFDQAGSYEIGRIAPHCGNDPTLNGRMLAYQNLYLGEYRSLFTKNANSDQLSQSATMPIAPIDFGPFDITEQLSESDLKTRAFYIFFAYLFTPTDPSSNRVYLDEAYYFVPVFLALQLQQVGQYIAALDWFRTVYDYATPDGQRNIWYGFELEKSLPLVYQRSDDWLLDPLNPHQIAATRAGTYLRFTLLALVRCFLDYADAEFTRDTAESLPRARRLYMTALELLDLQELNLHFGQCSIVIGELDIPLGGEWEEEIFLLKQALASISNVAVLKTVTTQVQEVLHGNDPVETRFIKAYQLIRKAQESLPPSPTVAGLLEQRSKIANQAEMSLLARSEINETVRRIGSVVGQDFLHSVASVAGMSEEQLVAEPVDLPWLAPSFASTQVNSSGSTQTTMKLAHRPANRNGAFLSSNSASLARSAQVAPTYNTIRAELVKSMPLNEANRVLQFGEIFVPGPAIGFCIPQNPILMALRLRAELNLFKLRNCRNIAGDVRTLEPYVAPTDTVTGLPDIGTGQQLILPGVNVPPPTPYRYMVLIEHAKQLISSAQQIEAAFLSALEKRDAEYYTLLKARQDVSLTKAGVRLQDLRVTEAQSGVKLAELQQERAQLQADHYQQLLDEGISGLELASLDLLRAAADLQVAAAISNFVAATLPSSTGTTGISWSPQGIATAIAGGLSSIAGSLSTTASILSTLASYERRAQEWEFQKSLAQQDIRIGAQQVKIAQDHVRVVGQEQKIAQLQADHAEAVADFLGNKFTSYELYDWMSGVLEGVYNYLLQQATATAQLALNQLAFERQQTPPPLIRADYWQPPSENGQSVDGKTPDRRGITGSARLLQDITQLDQYRFDTDKRKLQLTKTISVARLAPEAFVRFQETGVLTFETPMELFDRDFPGHYLRLIRRVRISVVALIPPTSGIRATLTSDRVSRVVVGGDTFQTVKVQQGPDYVALSSPREATGLFELDVQSDMLLPFEDIGVATTWEFRMPKAANLFDYRTIADVLLTIEYTALNSFTYGQQVIQSLNPNLSANRPFSFSNQFADPWYDLHNPDQTTTPMTVRFSTIREDFPPNLENLKIRHVALFFVRKADSTFEMANVQFHFTPKGDTVAVGGMADSIEGIISTRNGNGASWTSMIGLSPVGVWELALSNDQQTKDFFKNEEIEDMLFVLTYSGRTPDWPS